MAVRPVDAWPARSRAVCDPTVSTRRLPLAGARRPEVGERMPRVVHLSSGARVTHLLFVTAIDTGCSRSPSWLSGSARTLAWFIVVFDELDGSGCELEPWRVTGRDPRRTLPWHREIAMGRHMVSATPR